MWKAAWQKITQHRATHPGQSIRAASLELGIAKSTIHDQIGRQATGSDDAESVFLDSPAGQIFLKRLIVATLYTFGIKAGVGAGRIEEFMKLLRMHTRAGLSECSILRLLKEIEVAILRYQELVEQQLEAQASAQKQELEVVLGLDETWLDEMLLVCQELGSGYLFLKKTPLTETPLPGGNTSRQPSNGID